MSAFAIPNYDDFIEHPERRTSIGGIIENMDGRRMYAANVVSIELEVEMTINTSQPLTVGWAIGLSAGLVFSAVCIAAGTYTLLRGDVNDVRTSVDAVRDGASSDVTSLRADMRADFARMDTKFDKVGEKLDKITDIVTETKVQQAKNRN